MKPIIVQFNQGVQFPPSLGTLKLKLTAEGKASYAQNIDTSNDEYGIGAIVPGPALTTIGNNSELTGVPAVRQMTPLSAVSVNYLYFGQGLAGTKTIVRRIKNITSGSTPEIDTAFTNGAINHSGHTNQEIIDMVLRQDSSFDSYVYVVIKDDTDIAVYKFDGDQSNPTPALVTGSSGDVVNSNFTGGLTHQFLVLSSFDNNIYWIGRNRVSSIDTSDNYTVLKLALGLPLGSNATCGVDWQQQLVIAFSNDFTGQFSSRNSGGRAGIAIWDYYSPGIIRNIPAPYRFISALVNAPNGQLIGFGGVDEGKSTIFIFNGYGFDLVTQYIGDLPLNRHAVEFDGQGRIVWLTADGFLCRYDFTSGKFDNLGRTLSTGGILAKGIGSPAGNEFFTGSGSGSTYEMKKVQFGSYIGDDGGSDENRTPMSASGTELLPQGSNIQAITLALAKPLATGERVELRVYKNGSTTDYDTYLTMDYDEDGAISSKREVKTLDNINSFNLVAVWKQADGLTTAPPVLSATVEPGSDK